MPDQEFRESDLIVESLRKQLGSVRAQIMIQEANLQGLKSGADQLIERLQSFGATY